MKKEDSYRELLKDPRWIKKRNEILTRDENTCQYCGRSDRYMHVHHNLYVKGRKPWEYDNKDLITLCNRCHEIETDANSNLYDTFLELKNTFKSKGLSMSLLESLLDYITDSFTREDSDGESCKDSAAYEYVKDMICGTQNISDILAARKCGFELRDLMQNCYPQFVEKYDKMK